MNLGDLEFKASDLSADFSETIVVTDGAIAQWYADKANRHLRERLAKAPEVQSVGESKRNWWDAAKRWPFGTKATHRARLVAIEEIEK